MAYHMQYREAKMILLLPYHNLSIKRVVTTPGGYCNGRPRTKDRCEEMPSGHHWKRENCILLFINAAFCCMKTARCRSTTCILSGLAIGASRPQSQYGTQTVCSR
eukprot:scaffold1663_cov171-Amphora_coffeaeformis.AAC.26